MTIAWYMPPSNYLHLLETPISSRARAFYMFSLILELFVGHCIYFRRPFHRCCPGLRLFLFRAPITTTTSYPFA